MVKNRRIGPDTIMNLISWISILSWVIIGVLFIILAVTNPSGSSTMSAIRGGKVGGNWSTSAIYLLLVFLILLSVAGIFFNMTRLKRKTDKLRLTMVFSGILSIIGLIIMSVK